jgi:hypothetical protein
LLRTMNEANGVQGICGTRRMLLTCSSHTFVSWKVR